MRLKKSYPLLLRGRRCAGYYIRGLKKETCMVDWIIGIGVAVLVVLIIRQQFRKKRNGQSGCG
ncbi:FeoB-associated Cys-rich membrane protein [Faecalimonas umbilicata]|uniref:FeoB-associated Cys-rich membrane protein n=1 Tax=Faecalimonas umbilicata TaxID=1912855 RepID=UPI00242D0524|nr:FeoB-associated Cys-rich membrane protein [Faecalimonas umbilicata]